MIKIAPKGRTPSVAALSRALLVGAALVLSPAAALAQDGTQAAPAPGAEAPASEAPATEAPAAPVPPGPETVIATVGTETITEGDLAFAAEDLQENLAQVPPQDRRAFLVSVLIDMKVMAAAARAAGMDQTDLFKRRAIYLEESALRRSYFSEAIAGSVTQQVIQDAYDAFVADFEPVEEVHARHILVATKEEADAVMAEIAGGKPFELVAMEKTIDPSGKQSGGDLGFFSRGMMVPEFETAAFGLELGEVSEPVQSQFGWHVIRLDEKRQSAPPPIGQVAQQLGQQAMYDAYDKAIATLRAGVEVSIPDAELAAGVERQMAPAEAPATE